MPAAAVHEPTLLFVTEKGLKNSFGKTKEGEKCILADFLTK